MNNYYALHDARMEYLSARITWLRGHSVARLLRPAGIGWAFGFVLSTAAAGGPRGLTYELVQSVLSLCWLCVAWRAHRLIESDRPVAP